jgi:tetratricopeptide (TPR) repeat protein
MNEVGINPTEYTRLYQRRWSELMDAQDEKYLPLRRYVNGTVATTWIISYTAIREKNEYAANLLLLWAHLDNRSLWYELISSGSGLSSTAAAIGLIWLGDLARSEIEFIKAIGLLRSYSLVEEMTDQTGYATHPVVHQWAYSIQTDEQKTSLSRLAIMIVGLAIPMRTEKGYCATQIRLLPHADCCKKQLDRGLINVSDKTGDVTTAYTLGQHSGHLGAPELVFERDLLYHAVYCIGNLYAEWDNLEAAEKLYVWTLTGQEDTVGREDMWTLATAYSLGSIYTTQGKLDMADKMFQRVMQGRERTYGKDDLITLNAVSALAGLHVLRGNLDTAERLYIRALEGFKTAVGPKHEQTLFILYNLGGLYRDRGKLDDAEIMCKQALGGWTESFGLYHPYTLDSLTLLANLYMNTRRAAEAEKICIQVLEEYKRIRGSEHSSTLKAVHCLGSLYSMQGKLEEAEKHYKQALNGFERLLGPSPVCTFNPALDVMFDMGELYYKRHRFSEARGYYTRALTGYENSRSDQHPRCGFIRKRLSVMDQQDNNQMLPQPLPSQLSSSPADSRGQEDQRARQTRVSRFSRLKKSLQLKR